MQSFAEIAQARARNTNTKTLNTKKVTSVTNTNTKVKTPQTINHTQETQSVVNPGVSVSGVLKKPISATEVQQIAQTLTERLDNQGGYLFYCKVAWYLPANIIWGNLETALGGKRPSGLFYHLCQSQMSR